MGLLREVGRTASWGVIVATLVSSGLLVVGVLRSNAEMPIRLPESLSIEAKETFVPKALPRSEREPIAFHLTTTVDANGEHPPALRETWLDLDKHVEINAEDFSACPMGVVAHDTHARALQRCAGAIVGVGLARVEVMDPESGALHDASLRLTVFKGGVRGETTTLLFRLEPLAPSRLPMLAVAKSRPLEKGRFGTRMTIAFPRIAEGNGSIVSMGYGLRRRGQGKDVAGVMRASCPDGHLVFGLIARFVDGSRLFRSSLQACKPAP